jgi:hypothetical protein
VRGDLPRIVSQSKRIWLQGTEQFIIALLYPIVTIARDSMEAFDVQNGDMTPADLNKASTLEGALDQIDGGSLDAKHLSEKFLRQPDVIASQSFTALEKPPCCARLNLMERLAGSRLLRLREQGQIEQRNDLSEIFAGFPDAVDFRRRDAHSFASDLNDALGK